MRHSWPLLAETVILLRILTEGEEAVLSLSLLLPLLEEYNFVVLADNGDEGEEEEEDAPAK